MCSAIKWQNTLLCRENSETSSIYRDCESSLNLEIRSNLLLSSDRNVELSQLTTTSSRSFISETSQFHYFPSLYNNRRSDFRENDSSVRDGVVSWRAAAATTEGFLEDCCVIAINSTDAWPLAGESREIFIEVAEVGQTVSEHRCVYAPHCTASSFRFHFTRFLLK